LQTLGGGSDNSIGLDSADGFLGLRVLNEERTLPCGLHGEQSQRSDGIFVESESFSFLGFLFGDSNARADAAILKIVDIVPTQAEEVADSECGIYAEYNEDVVAEFATV
jgi:hypothetical protein